MDFTINGKPLNTLRVVDLKVELEKRGLPKSGNKNDLVGRLTQYFIRQQGQPQAENETAAYPQGTTIRQDMAGGVQPPNMSLSHGLTDNDFVRDEPMETPENDEIVNLSEEHHLVWPLTQFFLFYFL